MNTLTRDTTKSYLWNQMAVLLDGFVLMVASVVVGRLVGQEALGTYGLVLSAVGLTLLVGGLGFKEGIAVLVQRAGDEASLRGLFRKFLEIRAAAAVVASLLTFAVLSNSAERSVALAASGYVLVGLIAGLFASFNVALFQTWAVAAGRLACFAVSLVAVTLGAREGSLAVIFWGLTAGSLVSAVISFLPLRHLAGGPRSECSIRTVLELPATLWVLGLFNYLIGLQAAPMILKKGGVGVAEIAVFTVGMNVAMISNRVLMGGFANVILAAFSRAGEGDELARIHSLYVRATTILSMPVLIGSAVFAPLIAHIWLTGDVSEAVTVIDILVAWSLAGRLMGGGAHSSALYSSGLHHFGWAVRGAFALLSVGVTYACAVLAGIKGAAMASGAVSFLVVATEWALARRLRGIGMPWPPLARLTLYSLAAAVPAWLLTLPGRAFTTVLAVAVFGAGAIAALLVARPLSQGEAADIAGPGLVGGLLRRLEATSANG